MDMDTYIGIHRSAVEPPLLLDDADFGKERRFDPNWPL